MEEVYAVSPLTDRPKEDRMILSSLNDYLKAVTPEAKVINFPYVDHFHPLKMIMEYHKEPIKQQMCAGPLGFPVEASYGVTKDKKIVYIDLATVLGTQTVPKIARAPLNTTTRGVGQLMKRLIRPETEAFVFMNLENIATDLGVGMMEELGATFFDQYGRAFETTGGKLGQIKSFSFEHLDERFQALDYWILDNQNASQPLVGDQGISYVNCEQTGASPVITKFLDQETLAFSQTIDQLLGKANQQNPQSAIGNGFTFGCLSFFRHVIVKDQVEAFTEFTDFEALLRQVNYFITLDRYGPFRELLARRNIKTLLVQTTDQVPTLSENELLLPFHSFEEADLTQLLVEAQAIIKLLYFR